MRGDVAARDRACGDAGASEAAGKFLDATRRHHAAARVQQQKVAFVAGFRQPSAEPRRVIDHDRAERGVDHRGGEAFVLEDLGQDLRGNRNRDAGQRLGENRLHPLLVGRVGIGVHEADRHGRDAAFLEDACDLACALLVERRDDLARGVDALRDREAVAARHIRRRHVLVDVPDVVLVGAADLDHVAEALRAHHGGAGQATGDQSIRRHRRAVGEQDDVGEVHATRAEPLHHAVDRIRRRAGLGDPDDARVLIQDADVREGPADVDGHAQVGQNRSPTRD